MASTKEIKDRMKSINDTLKITNAMYMISSSKLKKARKRLEDTEPYFYSLQGTMERILRHVPDMKNIYFDNYKDLKPDVKTVAYVVVTADKGLAGAYNHNVLKQAEELMKEADEPRLYVLGELGRHYFEKRNIHIDQQFHYTVQNPSLSRARRITEQLLDEYAQGKLDEVYMIYTRMDNAVTETTVTQKILPLERGKFDMKLPAGVTLENMNFSPSPEAVMDTIVPNYVTGFVYGALVESFASEQNARMMAMETATKSAKNMLHDLDILYNRARQAAITQEITEVIAGAKAQKNKK